jgi:hypothetical protein
MENMSEVSYRWVNMYFLDGRRVRSTREAEKGENTSLGRNTRK